METNKALLFYVLYVLKGERNKREQKYMFNPIF